MHDLLFLVHRIPFSPNKGDKYDVAWGTACIRLIVLNAIAQHPRNAPWELFSLYLMHLLEDPNMANTMEEYVREIRQQFLHSLTPEERQAVLDQLPPEEIFKHFTPEERRRGLEPEERRRGLGPEELRKLQDYLKTLH